MSDCVFFIGGLQEAPTTVVKVIFRHVVFNHAYGTFPVGDELSFSEDDNVRIVGTYVFEQDFP